MVAMVWHLYLVLAPFPQLVVAVDPQAVVYLVVLVVVLVDKDQ